MWGTMFALFELGIVSVTVISFEHTPNARKDLYMLLFCGLLYSTVRVSPSVIFTALSPRHSQCIPRPTDGVCPAEDGKQ